MSSTDTNLIETILLAAAAPDAEISARVAEIGPDDVANAMLAEVACRAALLGSPAGKVAIQCDLGFGVGRLGYLLVLGDGRPYVQKGWDSGASAVVRQDLVDLLLELFGPAGPYGVTRELFPKPHLDPAVTFGLRQTVSAMSQRAKDLSDLAAWFGSDKWGLHWYTPHYQKYFEPYRELAVKVLEIGVGGWKGPGGYNAPDAGGESLRMWKHYFRRGLIHGLDIFDKTAHAEDRVRVLQGDQGDERFLESMAREFGPFDIVIDDGSHMSHHIITSFNVLFPLLRPGGLYVVEDLSCCYWPQWGGSANTSDQYGAIAMIKSLVDDLNHQDQIRTGSHEPSMTELMVTAVHLHRGLAVVEKGVNTEQGLPDWVRGTDYSRMYATK
jgi:demethylmacrocin O-methyltransferase